ncbi:MULTISPECIES: hypothetical protein [Bacillaceae]|jgi:hypothetical protein|uniref:hypothetical protein n=1 Tax=Bacillaceae TaxID=186817 RepID=UPI0011A109F6|nr:MULTISPECIES: hypothetical protein [Bacillaceae]MCM3124353.1 hypothetical protein [Mesobacillus sp. MER 33]MCM3234937.1 hypothetical protein [Mesobacillus sp. MER 48]
MKKAILLFIFWFLIIFSIIAQLSDRFIYWLSPNALSLIDERMTYTFVPVLINFFIVFLLWKIRVSKSLFNMVLITNTIFFLFYFYYQYGDTGLGITR